MARQKVTPWRTKDIILEVRQQLFLLNEDGRDLRRDAISRIAVWKLRGDLPHAVESTAALVDAVLHHQSFYKLDGDGDGDGTSTADHLDHSIFSIRATYTAAFNRFVTGICDIGRNRGHTLGPMSMIEVAQRIGMPLEFVELRHMMTHEDMAEIPRLAALTDDALKWLWQVYWSRLDEPLDVSPSSAKRRRIENELENSADPSILDEIKVKSLKLLKAYRRERREQLIDENAIFEQDPLSRTLESCTNVCSGGRVYVDAMASLFIEKRLIISADQQISLDGAHMLWDDLIDGLAQRFATFAAAFVQCCLVCISDLNTDFTPSEEEKEALWQWTLHCMQYDDTTPVQVIKWCCLYPSPWTERLGNEMMERVPALVDDWQGLLFASFDKLNGHTEARSDMGIAHESKSVGEVDHRSINTGDSADSYTRYYATAEDIGNSMTLSGEGAEMMSVSQNVSKGNAEDEDAADEMAAEFKESGWKRTKRPIGTYSGSPWCSCIGCTGHSGREVEMSS